MASFDFIESAAAGYRFLMREHEIIGQLALFPLAIKIVSFVLLTALDLEDNFLRQGLFLIPSYFAEGWLVTRLIRIALFQDYGIALTGDQKTDLVRISQHSRIMMGSVIIYVLTKMFVTVLSSFVLQNALNTTTLDQKTTEVTNVTLTEPSIAIYLSSLMTFLFIIWAFRFLWLYIPAAMGLNLRNFLGRIKSFNISLYMLGTWVLCFMPIAMMLIMTAELLNSIFPPIEGENVHVATQYVMACAQAFFELLATIVVSIGIATGIYNMYNKKDPKS